MNQHESRIYNGLIKECELAKFERDTLAEALRSMLQAFEGVGETTSPACTAARAALAILKDSK